MHAAGAGTLLEQPTHALTRVSGPRYNNTADPTQIPTRDDSRCA